MSVASVLATPALEFEPDVRSSTTSRPSIDFPALQPLDHRHPLLIQADYDPDGFLQTRAHVPLDELRGELRAYLSLLREELVQLINEDYEEFIALGVGLRGEAERLERLEMPLMDIHREVEAINDTLLVHEDRLQSALAHRADLREETSMLESMQKLHDTVYRLERLLAGSKQSERDLPRLGNEYSQILYLRNKLEVEGCGLVHAIEPRVDGIRQRVKQELADALIEAIQRQSTHDMRQCLKVYDIIRGWSDAQSIVKNLVSEAASRILQTSALQAQSATTAPETPSSDISFAEKLAETSRLGTMYNRLLDEILHIGTLASLAEEVSPAFAFCDQVIIPQVLTHIRRNLGTSLFLAGRPDELHTNYTITSRFLSALETLAPTSACVGTIRSSTAMAEFRRQWQLPVYFQLRWKEIVSKLERSLADQSSTSTEWSIPQTAGVYAALESCLSPTIFIDDLADRFWKLDLQIISRYREWLGQLVATSAKSDDTLIDDTALRINARAATDLDRLAGKAQSLFVSHGIDYPVASLLPNTAYINRVTEIVSLRCVEQLKPIRAVASQLRTTTVRPGGQPTSSAYIQTVFRPLRTILHDHPLGASTSSKILRHVAAQVFSQCAALLLSVRKTEDLLRRHRKGKKSGFSLFGSGSQEDQAGDIVEEERRFDEQMKRDVDDLGRQATGLGVPVEQLAEWRELEEVAERPLERTGD